MAFLKSGNPTLKEKSFQDTIFQDMSMENTMTINGTLNKFGLLFLLMMSTTFLSWNYAYSGKDIMPLLLISVFGGLGLALAMAFKKQWSPYLAPAYALLEGLFVGSISAMYAISSYPGLIMQAVLLTLIVTAVMFLLYRFRIIKVTQQFRSIITVATISIMAFYLIKWIASLAFGANIGAFTNAATPLGIGFSVFVVALAALNLLLDFDMIEKGSEMGAPKYMEWYGAFGLLVTLVWLYIEILRLLSKLKER